MILFISMKQALMTMKFLFMGTQRRDNGATLIKMLIALKDTILPLLSIKINCLLHFYFKDIRIEKFSIFMSNMFWFRL